MATAPPPVRIALLLEVQLFPRHRWRPGFFRYRLDVKRRESSEVGACVRDLNDRIGNPEKAAGQRPESDQTSACGCGRAAGTLRTLCYAPGRRRFFRTVVSR